MNHNKINAVLKLREHYQLVIIGVIKVSENFIISFTLFLYLDELKVFVSDEKK